MTSPHAPKVAGIEPALPAPTHTAAPTAPETRPVEQLAAAQDRLAGWISDLTTLHDLTEQLARTTTLQGALNELLRAGASLIGARRGLVVLEPVDGLGPDLTVGFGLGQADIGHIETVPRRALPFGRLLDGLPEPGADPRDGVRGPAPTEVTDPDIAGETGLDPRLREVAARLGYAASYAVALATAPLGEGPGSDGRGRIGAVVWLYDERAEPTERQRHLLGLYRTYATEHLARLVELHRSRETVATLHEELLPSRPPRVPGVRIAVRQNAGPLGGGDWYDALPLPDGALGLAVGAVTGAGPSAVAAMGRLRASLRAYAVMEGEDPVAVLSDLELLLRLTEPARSATALFAFAEPATADPLVGPYGRKITMAGAGHCPPLIVGGARTEYVETTLSAPLGMLACWEAPSVEVHAAPGETLLLYSDGLLHRTGEPVDRAIARLHATAAGLSKSQRQDPEAVVDHVLRVMLPQGLADPDSPEDVILLAAHFER